MHPTPSVLAALVAGSALFVASPLAAHDIDTLVPHPGGGGYLLGPGEWGDIDLIGQLSLSGSGYLIGDVAVSPDGNWAFLANRSCTPDPNKKTSGPGILIVDISNLASPQLAGFIPTDKDTRPGEGLQVVALATSSFSGTVLVINSEPCGPKGRGGITLYDVTDPQDPKKLTEHFTDGLAKNALTDSAFAWNAGNNAYAVISAAGSTDFVILDITKPKHPTTIASYNLETVFPFPINQPSLDLTETFITDIVVKQIGTAFMMLVTAGDAGHILLDVTNPLQIVPIAQTDYLFPDPQLLESTGVADLPEGNAHHAEFTADNAFIIGVDADHRPDGGTTPGAFDGWGYVHLYSATNVGGFLSELDTYAIPEAHDPSYAVGFGILSVHEVATHPQSPTRAYLAYRQGGFRAIEISIIGSGLVEEGGYLGAQGNDIWGVEAFVRGGVTYILASDREKGLYIFSDSGVAP